MSSTIFVNIVVQDANGKSGNVVVKDFIRAGDLIPERINVLAAEAAAISWSRLSHNNGADIPLIRDRTGTLVLRTVVGP